jgi:transposase
LSHLNGRSHVTPRSRTAPTQGEAPPGQLELSTASQAECVMCDETIERCINRLKQWRGLATRYEKRALNYRAMVAIAFIGIWLQS